LFQTLHKLHINAKCAFWVCVRWHEGVRGRQSFKNYRELRPSGSNGEHQSRIPDVLKVIRQTQYN